MYNGEIRQLAGKTYAQNGSLRETVNILKQKGYDRLVSATLRKWGRIDDWKGLRQAYLDNMKDYNKKVLDLDKQNLIELLDQKEAVRTAMKHLDLDKYPQAYAQLNFSYVSIMKCIMLLSGKNLGDVDSMVDEVISALFQDPVTSKVLQSRKPNILKLLKKKK